ncbi:hypothetical protein Tco_0509584, partial [Tanacetum coccineum]
MSMWITAFEKPKVLLQGDVYQQFKVRLPPPQKSQLVETNPVARKARNHNVNTTKTAWRPTGKVVGSVKSQWKPTGRHFALYDNCPLTRIMEPIVEPLELTRGLGKVILRNAKRHEMLSTRVYMNDHGTYKAFGLRINMCKSKIMGVHVDGDMVNRAARKLGCLVLKTPVKKRLSKWKMQTLSIGGRLTLVKSVLGSMPIFNFAIFKAPTGVLRELEGIRSHFFNGHDSNSKKATWVNWKKVLLSKDRGGLGVSSLYVMNRGLLFKWIWRFFTQGNTLWARVIKAIHGADGRIGANSSVGISSCWTNITQEMNSLSKKGIDLMKYMHIKVGNGKLTVSGRTIMVVKRCCFKIGFYAYMPSSRLENTGDFSMASVRRMIDDKMLLMLDCKTRWIKYVPIKVNVHAWKAMTDSLPTRIDVVSLAGECLFAIKEQEDAWIDKESSAAGTDNRPPMLVESDYESWKICIERYIRGKTLGKLIWRSIQNGPTPHPQITVTEGQGEDAVQVTRDKRDEEFTEIENNKELADIQATNILSQGLPRHVFNILNQTRTGKEIWDNVELLMKGSGKSLQQQKEELFDEYERFRAIGNESIHDYFVRFHKLINDMKITQLNIPTHQMNTKFVNNLPPYWAKYVTNVKNNKDISVTTYVELYTYLKSYEPHAMKTLKKQEQSTSIVDPLAYLAQTTHYRAPTQTTTPPPPQYGPLTSSTSKQVPQSSNDAMLATMNQIVNLLSDFQKQFPPTNNQLRTSSNSRSHAMVDDGQIITKTVQRRAPCNVGNTGNRGTQNYGQMTDNVGKK